MRLLWFLFVICGFIWVAESKLEINKFFVVFTVKDLNDDMIDNYATRWKKSFRAHKMYRDDRLYFTTSLLSSSAPDKITTLPNFYIQPPDYYRNLLQQFKSKKEDAASLKGLLKALQIATSYDMISWQVDSKQTDLHLLPDILQLIADKKIQVLIKDNSHRYQHNRNSDYSYLQGEEFTKIEAASKAIELQIEKETEKPQASENANEDTKFKELSAFIYDMVTPNATHLAYISSAIKKEIDQQRQQSSDFPNRYSFILSSSPEIIKFINTSAQYSAQDYQNFIEPFSKEIPDNIDHLEALLKLLETSPPNSRIHFLTNTKPNEKIELVPKIAELMVDKKIQVLINGHEDNLLHRNEGPLCNTYVSVYHLISLISKAH